MTTETTPVAGAESPAATPAPATTEQTSAPAAATPDQQPAADNPQAPGEPAAATQGEQPQATEDESKRQQKPSAQDRIKQVVAERNQARYELAAAQRELQRLQQPLQQPGPNATEEELRRHDLKEALRESKVDDVKQAADQAAEAARQARYATFEAKAEVVADRMPGLVEKFCALPRVSEAIAEFVAESDRGAEVAFFLTQNPNDATRISSLHPYHAGIELARIEARLQVAPQVRKVSQAPPPPPSMPGAPSQSAKSYGEMSMDEYVRSRKAGGS